MKNNALVALRRRQLDRQLKPLATFVQNPRPRQGWIREIRDALGMTSAQLARRAGVSQPNVLKLEHSEAAHKITLKSLQRMAEALDCTLVCALVPQDSLESIVVRQATRRAAELTARVEHTMQLEAQGRDGEEQEQERLELAQELLRSHLRELWGNTE